MDQKDKSSQLKRCTDIKNKKFIKRIKPWEFFESMDVYRDYYYHDLKRILLISQTLALPCFILKSVFLLVKAARKIFKIFRIILKLIKYSLYFPAKIILPFIQIVGRIVYHILFNRFSDHLSRFLRKLTSRVYHYTCEVTALIIFKIAGISLLIWFVSRFQIVLRKIMNPIKNTVRLLIARLKFCMAGLPSILNLLPLFIKARKIELSCNISHDIVKSFLGDYFSKNIKSNERLVSKEPLFREGLKHNSISSRLEIIDKNLKITRDDYVFFFHNQHNYEEIIETYSHFCRYPNHLAFSVISFLLQNLSGKIKLPVNKNIPEIYEAHKYFNNKKKTEVLSANYLLVIPVSSYDQERFEAGKLTSRILEAYLAIQCRNLHVKIILPLKPKHDGNLRKFIKESLSWCSYPETENVSWDILEPNSEIAFASVRGAQMLWAIDNIVTDESINDDTIIIISEMVGSVDYRNIPHLLLALQNNCIVTASRHVQGSLVLNKSIPDKLNSLIYNTYARILIPGNWSDSSAPLKLVRKSQLSTLLPYINVCSAGMLDFTFDEGLLGVAHSLSVKVIQRPIFWADAKQKGGAKRTNQGIKAQLHFTNILSKKIRMLRQIIRLTSTDELFINAGMDFNVKINKELIVKKYPVKLLNSLELLISSFMKKTVDHTRFGIIGNILIKILPNYVSKRIGAISENRFRNPACRLEALIPLITKCPAVENIKYFHTNNGFYFEQKMLPILLGDVLNLNVQYNNVEGIKSVLDNLIKLNKVLHAYSLFDGDFRSIKDTGISMGNIWHLKLIDFSDLIYRYENALQATGILPDNLWHRLDFMTIKYTLLSKFERANMFFDWYKNLKVLYKCENVIAQWKNESLFLNTKMPLIKQNKNKAFLENFTLLMTDGIGQMADHDSFNAQVALIPPMDIDFPFPDLNILPNPLVVVNNIHPSITVIFLTNTDSIISMIPSFMEHFFPSTKYRILGNSDSNEEDIKQLHFKTICSRLDLEGDIIIIPMDGQSSRMRLIMPKGISHKAFLCIESYPILYWVILSTIKFLVRKINKDDLILYIHGDTIANFENQIPEPSLYAPKNICRIGRVLPENSVKNNNNNQMRNIGKLLQAYKKEGWEFPGLFIIKKAMIPLLIDESLKQNFWTNVARMTKNIRGLQYKISPAFFDFDTPYSYWKYYLLAYTGKLSEKEIKYENKVSIIKNHVYIGKDSELEIINENDQEAEIELNNIVVTEDSLVKIHIPHGMKNTRLSNAIFLKSTGTFNFTFPSVTGVLAANFNGKIVELIPLTCYGIDSIHPLCPDITNENY